MPGVINQSGRRAMNLGMFSPFKGTLIRQIDHFHSSALRGWFATTQETYQLSEHGVRQLRECFSKSRQCLAKRWKEGAFDITRSVVATCHFCTLKFCELTSHKVVVLRS